jgi:neutral ceramidase
MWRHMKRVLKRAAWTVAAIAALLLATAIATLTTVDRTPYRQLPAFAQASSRLQRAKSASNVVFGELRAGFGRVRLTPTVGAVGADPAQGRFQAVPLAGYGARHGQPATGQHQELWVKAVAFAVAGRTGVVVSADALIIPRAVADTAARRICQAKGLTRPAVYFGATHTHASLGGWGEGYVNEQFAGGFVPGMPEWFAQQLASAATMALDDLSPASLGHGGFTAPEFVRNRLLGDGAAEDPEFSLLLVKQTDGDDAVVGAYAAHATVLPASNLRFSGDYPGQWALGVEKATGALAMFLAGGAGSHGPRAGAPGFDGVQRMGEALTKLSVQVLTNIRVTNRLAFGMLGVETPLPPLQVRVSEGVRLRPWVARALLPVQPETLLQGWRLGDGVWLSTPCDFSGELALDLKVVGHARGMGVTVTSFNGDYVGYVIPAKHYHLSGYEPRVMSFYGPQLPDYFMDVLGELTTALTNP